MPASRLLFAVPAAFLLLTGCQSYAIVDDIDLDFDFVTLTGPSDELHLPYVQGAQVNLSVVAHDDDELAHLTLESASPSVLHIDSQSGGMASCTALADGTAEIRVLRDGAMVYSTEIRVAKPTRAVLEPNGPLLVGVPIDTKVGSGSTTVLAGGTATYLVKYFDGDTPLFGNGALVPSGPDELGAEAQQTFLFENREWLQLSPTTKGQQKVKLLGGGVDLGDLTVNVVDETAVKKVVVEEKDTSDADDGDWEVVLAQAFDASGERIFGVEYSWERGGVQQTGEGDLFRYQFNEEASDTLTARFGDLDASTTIHAEQGFVSSSNFLGCNAAPGGPGSGMVGIAIAALGVALSSRRRRR